MGSSHVASEACIRLRGVRQNNLKNIDLDLPLGKLVVVTGLSGAGKSSLVFDTLHAEGQRRYVETFSAYTRQFLEMLDRPEVDRIENIRPSIAIQQSNTVKTSRSTVGTMTELADFFKVWFAHAAELIDPASGEVIESDGPVSMWAKAQERFAGERVLLCFAVERPEKLPWETIRTNLIAQGYGRVVSGGKLVKLEESEEDPGGEVFAVQDRIAIEGANAGRFLESAGVALRFGKGVLYLFSGDGSETRARFHEGLVSPVTGDVFGEATPNLFSFNSPIGACPTCRGFGRVIETDPRLVVPDSSLSLADGAIRAFSGSTYGESQRDLLKASKKFGIRVDVPYRELSEEERRFVWEGEPGYVENDEEWMRKWYGVRRFFAWLESNTYKMHVRVFLSRYRAYVPCPSCGGARLVPEALNWKWRGRTLPALYQLPVSDLLGLLTSELTAKTGDRRTDLAAENILSRLRYLEQVGLGYLTLDRTSRTLSGGETQRVNLTSCLGTSLVDTLFILDEPSIGLHARDIDRLIGILRRLTDLGNTVVVVEHDEAVMRAADWIVEIGPEPGAKGGEVVYSGPSTDLWRNRNSITGRYLSGAETIAPPERRRPVSSRKKGEKPPMLSIKGAAKHNLSGLDVEVPLGRLVVLSGVSGSGKSTLLENVIHQGILSARGKAAEDPAEIKRIEGIDTFEDVVLVDQSAVSRTPRSNPALFVGVWDDIRDLFGKSEAARSAGFNAATFSFNAGNGRCEHCQGLGYERIEMQFMADVYVPCPVCEGRRFQPEVLEVHVNGKSIREVLDLTVEEAEVFFGEEAAIRHKLGALRAVGLGYLPLGQPLNTLSGGESQRLKLIKYLGRFGKEAGKSLLLLDEPTTGLHRDDVKRLLQVMQELVETGHSLVVIEHHLDVLRAADWVIELGPEAGAKGGKVVFAGTPEALARKRTATSPFLREEELAWQAAEPEEAFLVDGLNGTGRLRGLEIEGAREHNLRNLSLTLPYHEFTVLTGVSGSGKSTLAFDIVFAEGQRRFMESMSPYARQFVEQLPKPEVDRLAGIPPTVAIEQRVTRGTRKSTVATITEVAQYVRLLYARVGVQHSPRSGKPVVALSPAALQKRFADELASTKAKLYLCAPLIRGRKGHHEPLAKWAKQQGFETLRIDGAFVAIDDFKKLNRYAEHDIEVVVATFGGKDAPTGKAREEVFANALKLGKGSAFLAQADASVRAWFSTKRVDPETGEAFPELDPKHFSWNSPKGWCPTCRGHGRLGPWLANGEEPEEWDELAGTPICPECQGTRLNAVSRSVRLPLRGGTSVSLPELLAQNPKELIKSLKSANLDKRGKAIAQDLVAEVSERLRFMDTVGLGYLTLDRATNTLSGGEAQRIRLAAQLGSNLAGVLYVLDEPSIGLHARDNNRLLKSLEKLRDQGNSLLVVEHDDDTMRRADRIIDLGPGAGEHGGELLANGTLEEITKNPNSLTGQHLKHAVKHPLRGERREISEAFQPRSRKKAKDWLVLQGAALRNLKGEDLHLPLGRLIGVCGPSGAGKSTLIRDLLQPAVRFAQKRRTASLEGKTFVSAGNLLDDTDPKARPFRKLINGNACKTVIEVDQNPIGKTPRSTPATYLGAFDIIREFFASLPEAKLRGYTAGTFSFNTKGGRCEKCKGAGRIKVEMNFLPDSYVRCDACEGLRYGPEVADIRWKGKTIGEVLRMSFEEAAEFFSFHARLQEMMELAVQTGLGYLRLGQSSPSLSGGEAQRLKLVTELCKGLQTFTERSRGIRSRNLYLLEEPTIGLHLSDCVKLIHLLHRLVDQGHTVVVIEHHLDILAEADWLVEVGPDGGEGGGQILYQGAPEGILAVKGSPTAKFLKRVL